LPASNALEMVMVMLILGKLVVRPPP